MILRSLFSVSLTSPFALAAAPKNFAPQTPANFPSQAVYFRLQGSPTWLQYEGKYVTLHAEGGPKNGKVIQRTNSLIRSGDLPFPRVSSKSPNAGESSHRDTSYEEVADALIADHGALLVHASGAVAFLPFPQGLEIDSVKPFTFKSGEVAFAFYKKSDPTLEARLLVLLDRESKTWSIDLQDMADAGVPFVLLDLLHGAASGQNFESYFDAAILAPALTTPYFADDSSMAQAQEGLAFKTPFDSEARAAKLPPQFASDPSKAARARIARELDALAASQRAVLPTPNDTSQYDLAPVALTEIQGRSEVYVAVYSGGSVSLARETHDGRYKKLSSILPEGTMRVEALGPDGDFVSRGKITVYGESLVAETATGKKNVASIYAGYAGLQPDIRPSAPSPQPNCGQFYVFQSELPQSPSIAQNLSF